MNIQLHPTRVVLIATHMAGEDLPVGSDMPRALLPFGTQTLIERQLDQFSRLGLSQVDIVVSSGADELHKVVGTGERWGLQIFWHWVQTEARAYSILRSFNWEDVHNVLFARADQWISDRALTRLLEAQDLMFVPAQQPDQWTGWAHCHRETVASLRKTKDATQMAASLQAHIRTRRRIILREDWATAESATDLLALQKQALATPGLDAASPFWVRTEWGVMSPQAWVDPQASIKGPAIIGPGCFIAAHAHIGPGTVLCANVTIDTEVRLADVLVLPGVYLSGATQARHSVINKEQMRNTRAHQTLPVGLARPVHAWQEASPPKNCGNPIGQFMALATLGLLTPVLALDWLVRSATHTPTRWALQPVLHGHPGEGSRLHVQLLNEPTTQAHIAGALLARCGRLIDVVRGKRQWFGVRSRTLNEWQHLSGDWRYLLAKAPLGLIHAPAWRESGEDPSTEAQATADVFYAVSSCVRARLHICISAIGMRLPHLQPALARSAT
jgi:NDP-sugar pyrophosphorylase family protein